MSSKDRKSIALEYPVTVSGVKLDRLTMRRPLVRDLLIARKAGSDDVAQEIRLFSNLCEVEPNAIEELDLADYSKLQEAYEGFRKASPGKPNSDAQ